VLYNTLYGIIRYYTTQSAKNPITQIHRAKLLEEIRLGHSSAERRPEIADVKNGVTGPVRPTGPSPAPPMAGD
jgi:hypothetical protein